MIEPVKLLHDVGHGYLDKIYQCFRIHEKKPIPYRARQTEPPKWPKKRTCKIRIIASPYFPFSKLTRRVLLVVQIKHLFMATLLPPDHAICNLWKISEQPESTRSHQENDMVTCRPGSSEWPMSVVIRIEHSLGEVYLCCSSLMRWDNLQNLGVKGKSVKIRHSALHCRGCFGHSENCRWKGMYIKYPSSEFVNLSKSG